MYHLRLKGGHYEMGVKRGKIFQKCQVSFPLHLDEFQLEHGKRSEAALRKYFPEVCEEIRGVSDAIGADYLRFASWMLCMGCCMYNLENKFPPLFGDALLSHMQKAEESYMAETMTCRLICGRGAKVKSMPRRMEIDLILRHPLLLTGRRE